MAGNKISTINRTGDVRAFAYDKRNREIRSDWSDGSQTIVKAYDAAGRMTLEDNGVSRITFAFDEAGRLASETQDLAPMVTGNIFDPEPRRVSYAYDDDGRKATLTYPDGSFVRYIYDARGQMHEILADGVPPPIASYEYDLAGNATRMPRENFTTTVREYDDENKVTGIVDYDPRRSPFSELDYTYDEAGNRTSTTRTDLRAGHSETTRDSYLYDATFQVTGADYEQPAFPTSISTSGFNSVSAQSVRFTYDAVGNRIEVSENGVVTRYTTNNLNQYTRVGAFVPTHDRNGNLAGMGEWLYRYDAMNRLIEASNGSMTARFFYDAKNRCVARSYNGRVQLNTYDDWNLIEERDSAGQQQARYVHGRRIDEIVVMVNRHGVFYPHHDVLGNVTMLTGIDGAVIERYKYSVDGNVIVSNETGQEMERSAVGNRWMFTGREWLAEIRLYDYRNRVYSQMLGRFMQRDPIRFHGKDINIYRYAANNFVNYIDPQGLDYDWAYDPIFGASTPFNDTGIYQLNEYEQLSYFGYSGGDAEKAVGEIRPYEESFSTALNHFHTQMEWLNAGYENSGPGIYGDLLVENFGPLGGVVDTGFALVTAAATVPAYAEAVADFLENTGTVIANHISGWWDSMWE